jgi:gliding motility-associated-like protein
LLNCIVIERKGKIADSIVFYSSGMLGGASSVSSLSVMLFLRVLHTAALFFLALVAVATHNRAGEITYRHISGLTYEITITTCTKTSVIADREWLKINWGDNFNPNLVLDSLQRDSVYFSPTEDWQLNWYSGIHTYPGPGEYILSMQDPNRNDGVNNIPGSVNVPFYVESLLVISPLGHNNSVLLLNSAKENCCLNALWIHNPGAYDVDGDSLVYTLIHCMQNVDEPIPGYQYPDNFTSSPSDLFYIDSQTGDVVWDVPSLPAGEYNIAFRIDEFRNGFRVGYVIRDMQITVQLCNNNPPDVVAMLDTCVEVGQNLQIDVEVNDPDGNNFILEAIGGPLSEVENTATFNPNNGLFNWTPGCEEVRPQPYQVLFRAEDFGNQIALVDIESVNITVVAPAVENPQAEALGNTVTLTWDVNPCLDAVARPELGEYKIYRRSGLYGFDPSSCELGVPAYTGYQYIGSVEDLQSTTYTDEFGLSYGGIYCYMVVTCFPNGAISYASVEFCAEIMKDAPVMTNVSVVETSAETGTNYVAWSPPGDLDLNQYPGPYYYELYYSEGFSGSSELIYSTTPAANLFEADTTFNHVDIDSENNPNNYSVLFYADGIPVSVSTDASSLFLSATPNDNALLLSWTALVPWQNTSFEVYRFDENLGDFTLIGSTTETSFADTGLQNNTEYCYFVRSSGTFAAPNIIDPVINDSQILCAEPYDLDPPCAPVLSITVDCENEVAWLSWTNPNNSCADDVTSYTLYYAPVLGQELLPVATIFSSSDTSFAFNLGVKNGSIAGCYAVAALDSLLPGPEGVPNQNESEFSNVLCADNCPLYFLPNVFTPNSDGVNDLFIPLPYKFIESVDFKVFNRWGGLVFETADPSLNWNGASMDSGEVVSDGVYFYVATVNTIRLTGIEPVYLKGTLTILGGDSNNKISK